MEGLIFINENLHGSSFVNYLFKAITMLGDSGLIWIILAFVLICFRRTRASGIVMLISLAIGFVLNDFVLKNLFSRARPFAVNQEISDFIKSINMEFPSGYSFPSGHSYSSFNCAIILTFFHKKWGYALIPLASVIAFSRIFLCVHYPTDMLAGCLLGIITAVCVYAVFKKMSKVKTAKLRQRVRKNG